MSASLTTDTLLQGNQMKNLTVMLATAAALVTACDGGNTPITAPLTPPTVTSTGPANLAINVPRNPLVTAVFSGAMTASTLNATTFSLKAGTTVVPGVVTYVGTTATLVPTGTLASNTVYTATISTGAKDLAGTALAANKTWSFTTVASSITGPAVVNLGTAGNYVILAKTGVSTTGAGSVLGDIGLSPAAASFITGFSLIADPSNVFSTSSMVTGQIRAADYAPPTPTVLTTAVLDMQTAYTDAAGRVLPDFTELGAGNIDGMTLSAGLYKWGTGVTIPIGVTLTGGVNDVWIFQIAQNLTVANGAIITLAGGAQAKNIFWQVAGQATLGTTSAFKGNILSQTLISFNTGATITGRALAQSAVTLNATAVTKP